MYLLLLTVEKNVRYVFCFFIVFKQMQISIAVVSSGVTQTLPLCSSIDAF